MAVAANISLQLDLSNPKATIVLYLVDYNLGPRGDKAYLISITPSVG